MIFAQNWNDSEDCNINVNDPNYENLPFRSGAINSTVKLILYGTSSSYSLCSGTLINRNTSDSDVGFYILTARHCVDEIVL